MPSSSSCKTPTPSLRARARAAGIGRSHWYPAGWSSDFPTGEVREVALDGKSYAVFRGADGEARAIANRCAHRPVPLAMGEVRGCELVCPYHGWSYDGAGRLVDIPHSRFGKKMPKLRVDAMTVRERFGLVWICPHEDASSIPLPLVPALESEGGPWPAIRWDGAWDAHHSAVIDNVLDLTHAHLHRRFQPFVDPELEALETDDDSVRATYRTRVGGHAFLAPFIAPGVDLSRMTMSYFYPHHESNLGDDIRHAMFLRPIDARRTHIYGIFATRAARVPGWRGELPRALVEAGLRLMRRLYLEPLLAEDRAVLEAEQRLGESEPGALSPELNPVVRACHALTVAKSSGPSCAAREPQVVARSAR